MSVFIQCLYSRGDARVSEETEKAVMCTCMNESAHQLVIAARGGGVTGMDREIERRSQNGWTGGIGGRKRMT